MIYYTVNYDSAPINNPDGGQQIAWFPFEFMANAFASIAVNVLGSPLAVYKHQNGQVTYGNEYEPMEPG